MKPAQGAAQAAAPKPALLQTLHVGGEPRGAAARPSGPAEGQRVILKMRDERDRLHGKGGPYCSLLPFLFDPTLDGAWLCEPCLAYRRKQQIRDFKREMEAKRQAFQQSHFVGWHFPHTGKEGKHCGAKVFRAHDNPTGPSHFWAAEMPCRNRDCPTCGPKFNVNDCRKPKCEHRPCAAGHWEKRIAAGWTNELQFWMKSQQAEDLAAYTHQRRLPVVHFLVSVDPKDWDKLPAEEKTREALDKIRTQAHRYAKQAGMVGAYWALHGKRVPTKWNQRACSVDGLHFHYVGVTNRPGGYVDGQFVARLHKRRGWILKRIGRQDSFFGTALYQLSHATWAEYDDGGQDDDDASTGTLVAPGYPALVHNSQTGRSCGRIGWFLGLGGQAPPVPLQEDACLVCGHDVPPSMRYEVWKLSGAPPPGQSGELDWNHWTDIPPATGDEAVASSRATHEEKKQVARQRCTCNGGVTPQKGCCRT